MTKIMEKDSIIIRTPNINDGARIWELVQVCKPLDLNSSYLYLLLCHHFSDTCLLLEKESKLVGFVSAYFPPRLLDVLFVWQIAIHQEIRGYGWAKRLLHQLIQQKSCERIKFVTSTVSPSNTASRNLFNSFAKDLKVDLKENVLFTESFFPEQEKHEEEVLFQIGPLR